MAHPGFGPPSLPVGTEVSAKYRGAFCEAKVKSVVRVVKCKVVMKDCQTSIFVTDAEINGPIKIGSVVQVSHPESSQPVEGTINKLIDHSTYTVVFDDGDERTLRRSQLCLKGDKHFIESETLDNLPLSHPEHFGTPVLQNKKAKRKNDDESDDEMDGSEEESPRRAMYRGRHQELVGKLMLVDFPNRKGSVIPVLVVLPDANSLNEVKNKDQILVRCFKDSKFMTVTRKGLKDFSRAVAIKNDDKTMKTAFEKALLYYDTKELPVGWNKEEMLGSDIEDDDAEDEYASEDEPFEEKDRFVAQLYKFMDERGTPINKAPCIANKDLNLYKLFKIVEKQGGYNKVTKDMKWPVVYSKMGLPSLHPNPAHQIKTAYKKYLDAFETFYRKLGSTMGTLSRPGRARQSSGCRSILNPRSKEKSPRALKRPEKVNQTKDDFESSKPKPEILSDKPEDSQDVSSSAPADERDAVTRRTPQRDAKIQSLKEDGKEKKEETEKFKKEEPSKNKKDDKKDESSVINIKKEEETTPMLKKSETTPGQKIKKDDLTKVKKDDDGLKKEERKSARKNKVEEEKEIEKDEKKSLRGTKKQKEDEKKEEIKEEALTPVTHSPKKRVTRRKLMPTEVTMEPEEEVEEKKEQSKKPVIKDTKTVEKKEVPRTLERRDSPTTDKKEPSGKVTERKEAKSIEKKAKNGEEKQPKKGQEDDEDEGSGDNRTSPNSTCSDEEEEIEQEKPDSNIRHDCPIGSKLKVKYGRGKNQKIYIAKVIDYGKDGVHKTYLVHYAGWNTRYDEWIRPDRVVAVLEKPDESEEKTPPLRSSSFSCCVKKTPPSSSNTPKTPSSQNKLGQVFRTPRLLSAKARTTRSSSSDTSIASKGKRVTRRHSVLTDSAGSKSPESNMSSDAEDASDFERADDDDNTKENNTEEDDILDVEEYEEAEEESLKGKSADSSVEAELSPSEDSISELGSEKVVEKEEDEEGTCEKDTSIVGQAIEKTNTEVDSNTENEQKGESSNSVKEDISVETVDKCVNSIAESLEISDIKRERATIAVTEVLDSIYEIRSAMFHDDEEIKQEEGSGTEEAETKSVSDINLDVEENIAPKLEIIEGNESDEKEDQNVKADPESDKILEVCAPVLLPDPSIPQLKKVDVEQEKKDSDTDKSKSGRGRKNNTPKEGRKLNKISDPTGANLASDIPTLEPILGLSVQASNKLEPSPYDFDAEVDTPWHPEITKKWEPSQKSVATLKEGKDSVTGPEEEDEKDSKKVNKKAKKKTISPEFIKKEEGSLCMDESASIQINDIISPICGDISAESKGRRRKGKKVIISETKKEVMEMYESTVNSVVEAVKHSLQETESDQEQKPAVKRRSVKRVSESDKKDSNGRMAKMRRKFVSKDSPEMLDSTLEDNGTSKTDVSHSLPLNESVLFQSIHSVEMACASTSAVEPEETVDLKDIKKESSVCESQGFEPQQENLESSATFDNTPPTTPEYEEEGNTAMQHHDNQCHSNYLSPKTDLHTDSVKVMCSSYSSVSLPASSNLAPSKSASESPSDNDVTSTTSNDNLDATLTAQQSESSDQDVPSSRKRKILEDTLNNVPELKKKRVHGTRSRTAKKSPKYVGNSDSQGSPSNTPSHCPESPPTKFEHFSKSPRPCKFNFNADLGEYLEGEARCNFLISKMREIKAIYMNLKAEVASIDRRRKRAKRKEKESSQMSTHEKEITT